MTPPWLDITDGFSLPADRVWLNAAHQGPLPNQAADRAGEMVRWKQQPHHIRTPAPFLEVPTELRSALGEVLGANADEIALANSSSYGIHLVANGLGLGAGDEVIVAANDFPSTILPWLRLRDEGVGVVQIEPAGSVVSVEEVAAVMTTRTRAVCLTWVHSFSGQMIDFDGIGDLCRRQGALFVVNVAQGVGAIPLSVHEHPVDVVTGVGFKWLCGPYGTGFCWIRPDVIDRIAASKLYWLGALTADDLARPELDLDAVSPPPGAARHDIFGTANFFNFAPWAESIRFVLDVGVERIHAHDLALVDRLVAGLDPARYEVQDRGSLDRLTSIVTLRPLASASGEVAQGLDEAGVDVAHRRGLIRLSPHLYNTPADIDRALDALNAL